jgi:ligand-binding sensor domain-containing protein
LGSHAARLHGGVVKVRMAQLRTFSCRNRFGPRRGRLHGQERSSGVRSGRFARGREVLEEQAKPTAADDGGRLWIGKTRVGLVRDAMIACPQQARAVLLYASKQGQ